MGPARGGVRRGVYDEVTPPSTVTAVPPPISAKTMPSPAVGVICSSRMATLSPIVTTGYSAVNLPF